MKNLRNAALILLLVLGACKKSDNNNTNDETTADAAAMVATTLSANSNGVASISADVTVNAQAVVDLNLACGSTKSYNYTHQNPQGSATTYSYTLNYNYTLNCNTSNQPDNVTGSATDAGSFDGPRLSSNNTGSATFKVAGLTQNATTYAVNGEYKRMGTFTSKVGDKTSSTSTVDVTLSNILINKSNKTITSGTATVTVSGSNTKNGSFNFTGSITFNGNGKATVTLNGTVYIVNLVTGEYTQG